MPTLRGEALERLGERQQLAHLLLVASRARRAAAPSRAPAASVMSLPGWKGISLAMPSQKHVRQIEHAADVAHRRLGRHRAERRDLRHRIGAVLLLHVVDDAVAAVLAEVDVEVRHRHALGIEEALEQQRVAQRIEVGDAERIGDQRAGAGAAAGPDRHAVALRPVDEVGDDQEVAGEAHLHDGRGLEFEARDVLGPLARRARRRRDRAPRAAARGPRPPRARRCSSMVTPSGVGKSGR